MMRLAIISLALAACASSTVPQSEACHEVQSAQCDALQACGDTGNATECRMNVAVACTTAKESVEVSSDAVDRCLDALRQYTCSGKVPMFGSGASMCLEMY